MTRSRTTINRPTPRLAATALLCLGLTQLPGTASAADLSKPAMMAHSCAGCHGTNGSSVGPSIPSIAGMDQERFIDAMLDYRRGERAATIMTRMAKGYTDADIAGMADFFAEQELIRYPQPHDPIQVFLGEEIHMESCEQCHADGGRDPSKGGYLAGQWMTYLRFSMDDYEDERRPQRKKMMRKVRAVVAEHGEEGIDALINYYGSQD